MASLLFSAAPELSEAVSADRVLFNGLGFVLRILWTYNAAAKNMSASH
jgi:hypothetical protein